MEQKIIIFQHQNLLPEEFKTELLTKLNSPNGLVDIEIHNIKSDGIQNNIPDMLLHVYIALGPDFWSSYFSRTLASGTVELIKFTLKSIGESLKGKYFTYLQSDGLKKGEVNYGLKVHPTKGMTLEYHISGKFSERFIKRNLQDLFKHVERLKSEGSERMLEIFELDEDGESFVKKSLKK